MAGRKEYELLFKLQATLGSGFKSSFNSAMSTARQLQGSLSEINKVSGKIESFQKQTSALEKNREKLAQLTEEHERLQREISQTEEPSEDLRQKMERNERQISQTTAQIERQESRLSELGDELRESGVDTDSLTEENERLAESYEKIKKSQENLAGIAQAQQQNSEAISKTRSQLTGTIGGIAAVGTAIYTGPVQSAIELESKMADVVKVVDGLKDAETGELTEEYEKMKNTILELSTQVPLTADGLAEIAAAAGQAGISRDEITKFTEDAAKMGIAFDTTADQAGSWMATWRTSFKMSQDEVVALADQINYLSNTSNATATEISGIVSKVGPLGEMAGLTSGEVAALGATLVATGVQEDVAATGIKKLMTTMTSGASSTARQLSALDKLGISATDLAERMQVDAQGAILDFMAAVQKLPQAEQTAVLKDYFGEEAIASISKLTTNTELLESQFLKVGDAAQYAGSMESEFASRSDTTENKIQLAKNSLERLSVVLGDTFLPYVETAAEKLTEVVTMFSEWAQENPELLSTIVKVVAAIAGFGVAGLAGKLAFLEIKGGILAVQGAWVKMKALTAAGGIKGLFGGLGGIGGKLLPIIGVVGGIAVAVKLISGNLEEVRGWIQETFGDGALAVFDKVWAVVQNVGAALSGIFSDGNIANARNFFEENFGEAGVAVFDALIGVVDQLKAVLPGILDLFAQLVSSLLPILGNLIQQLLPLVGQIIASILPVVANLLAQIIPVIGQIIEAILPVLIQLIETLVPIIMQIAGTVLPAMQQLLGILLPVIMQIIESILPVLIQLVETLVPVVMQIIETVLPVLQQLLETLLPVIMQIVESVLPVVINLIMMAVSAIQPLIQAILPVLQSLLQTLMPIIQAVAELFGNVLGAAINAISGILSGLTRILSGLITFITGVFTGDWTQAWEGVKNIFSGIWEAIKSACTGVINGIISAINAVIGGLNNLKIPDWVPGIGGKGINIPLIPMLAKGSKYTPDTFIAGEKGAELITNARGRTVFTAAQTGRIMQNISAAQSAQDGTTIVTLLPLLQAALSTARVNADGVSAPSVTAGEQRQTSVVIHSAPVFHVGTDAQAEDIEEMLNRRDEELLQKFDDRAKEQADNERRRKYD